MKKKLLITVLVIFGLVIALEACGFYLSRRGHSTASVDEKNMQEKQTKNISLKKRLAALTPRGTYLVIDTARNRLYVRKGEQTLKEIVVSTGSGSILKDPAGNRQWIFDTPRGERSVQVKKTNPVWTKPDWAFIEEGETVPKNFKDRIEEDVLGDYAFELGDGYMIHGTLYTRLLGRNVTHGCVRVGDKDLKELYDSIPVGTKVLIF